MMITMNLGRAAGLAVASGLLLSLSSEASPLADLPWEDLSSELSGGAVLLDATPEIYLSECTSFFQEFSPAEITQWDLEPEGSSGVCMNALVCGYEECSPTDNDDLATANGANSVFSNEYSPGNPTTWVVDPVFSDPANPRFNLPYKVLQPKTVGDIVAAVQFAAENEIEVSVKNSGHSYSGSSTKKDTLLIYTRTLPAFSPSGVQDCTSDTFDNAIDETLSNQPCALAKARNVPGAMRVGGGENFNAFYSSVKAVNEVALQETGSYKYHPVGGASASVTPMGWTFQGGLSGNNMGRTFGFGVDQVLQVEMVLPDGSHVRFGPTEWEDAEGYRYPKTITVSGVCNENPFAEDESDYVWVPCTNGVNFNDLWFAVRGGGGGTWGVVVSIYLQIHDYPGEYQELRPDFTFANTPCNATEVECGEYRAALSSVMVEYTYDFLYIPELVTGLDVEASNKCGKAGPLGPDLNYCYGEGIEAVKSGWKTRLMEASSALIEIGVPEEMIEAAMTTAYEYEGQNSVYRDYVSDLLDRAQATRYPERGVDIPQPAVQAQAQSGVLVPRSVAIENRDYWVELAKIFVGIGAGWPFYTAHADNTDDQMSSLSAAHRTAAYQVYPSGFTVDGLFDATLLGTILTQVFGGVENDGNFPGILGSNHLGVYSVSPLKSDWTVPCTIGLEEAGIPYTKENIEEACVPALEMVYGTERVARLEAIKAEIDPMGMFDCFNCISTPEPSMEEPEEGGEDDSTDPSSVASGVVPSGLFFAGMLAWIYGTVV